MALNEELKTQGDFLFKHRSYLPLILLALGLFVKIFQGKNTAGINETGSNDILQIAYISIGILGLAIRAFTVGYSPRNTSGRNTKEGQIADELNTTGLYSLIRNPLYLGNYLMWLSVAMLTNNIWFVLLFSLSFWIYYERIVFTEEQFLRNKFGQPFLDWAKVTPPMIPKHFAYKRPEIKFDWGKVLKKEKNGLFALFFIFLVFEKIDQYLGEGTLMIDTTWITIGAFFTGILYVVLKFLKKFSNVLDRKPQVSS